MSLTSYRTAPPRARGRRPGSGLTQASRYSDWGGRREAGRDVGAGPAWRRRGAAAGRGRCRSSAIGSRWTSGSTWRRPALPPLLGQYPGRGGVSRPSSEWGRVGPPRCDHQVEPEVQDQMTDDRLQKAPAQTATGSRCGMPRRRGPSREALGHGWQRSDVSGQMPDGSAPGDVAGAFCHLSSVICHLTSDLACLGLGTGAAFERLGPLGCTGCPASTCGLSTWWSTTALDETWFGGGFPA
jgi:hypothetical protein